MRVFGAVQQAPQSFRATRPGLRIGVSSLEEESRDLLKSLFADVHGAVDAVRGFEPIRLTNRNGLALGRR